MRAKRFIVGTGRRKTVKGFDRSRETAVRGRRADACCRKGPRGGRAPPRRRTDFDPLIRISAGFLGILMFDFIDEDQNNSLLTHDEINDAAPNFTQLNEETKPHAFDNDNQERYGAARSSWRRQTITVNPPAAAPTGSNRWCRDNEQKPTRGRGRSDRAVARPAKRFTHTQGFTSMSTCIPTNASSSSRTEALTTCA